jgi:hypothetical protein
MSHPTGLAGLVELGRRPDLSGYRVALVFAARADQSRSQPVRTGHYSKNRYLINAYYA